MFRLHIILYIVALVALSTPLRTSAQTPCPADTTTVDASVVSEDSLRTWPQNVQYALRELIAAPLFERSQLGLYVYDLTADSALFAYGKRQLMRPASTEKLLTAITALAQLGGSYRLETCLYRTGEQVDSVLKGDLFFIGGFDPRFGHDDLRALVSSLSEAGITRVEGSVCLDLSMKDTLRWGWGWCWDDELEPLCPLTVNGHANFKDALGRAFREAGICYGGTLEQGHLPADAILLGTRSHSIDQILGPMLKKSDNLYAEALFYQLGRQSGRRYADREMSADYVKQFIAELGLSPENYEVADGSGLSLYNYATPELLVEALRYAYRESNIFAHLYPALPIAGCDGTLRHRMRRGNAYANVRAKTGTVEGVSTLAGYATAANGHRLCFAIMNQGIRRQSDGRRFQDRVCEVLTAP